MIIPQETARIIGLALMCLVGFGFGFIIGHGQSKAEQIREMINAPRKD